MADVEIILSDSSDETIICSSNYNFSPQNQKVDSDADIEDIVSKYISENCVHLNDADLENNYHSTIKCNQSSSEAPPVKKLKESIPNFKDNSLSESSSSQDDSLNEIDTLKILTEKYKRNLESSTERDKLNSVDKPLSMKDRKKQERELQRQQKNEERERKKSEKEREKSLKQALIAANRNIKPGECMKFIRVQIDTSIVNEEHGKDIISALQAANVAYNVESQIFPYTISWIRTSQSHVLSDDGKLTLSSEDQETDEILLIMKCKEFVEHVSKGTLTSHIQSLKTVLITKKITVSVFGLDSYIRHQNIQKQKEFKSRVSNDNQKQTKEQKIFKDFPRVSRKNIEYALTELQILCNCSHRLIHSATEMGLMVAQFTKSIAELPYKLQKQEKYQRTDWFASGDNKDCVKVDKDGNGLQRLWNQMLTTFPLASLETAEAISSKYPTVNALMETYESCETRNNAELLLGDIPIRRAAGPISTMRRIGPELSKKVSNFFNAVDGDALL